MSRRKTAMNEVNGVYSENRTKYTGNITIADAPPVLIPPAPSVLDDIGLKAEREVMDAEHNRMIRAKYDLAVYKVTPALIRPANTGEEKSPFDHIYEKEQTPQPVRASQKEVQQAIDAQSICDPQYRAAAKTFLNAVIPEVDAHARKLTAEVIKAENELAHVQKEYGDRVRAARAELEAFNEGIYKEYRKFETANAGSTIESGHSITTSNCKRLVSYAEDRGHRYRMLQAVRDVIDTYEAGRRSVTPERIKEVARNSNPQGMRRTIGDIFREIIKGE